MIVLHALWDYRTGGQLHIWAESSSLATATSHSAKHTGKKPHPHPFILPSDALKEQMGKLAGSLLAASASTGTLALCLPSTARAPLASSELIVEREVGAKPAGLQPWEVETLVLEPDAALDFLLALPPEVPSGVASGSSLRFWRESANFAFALISRQSYAPVLREQNSNGLLTMYAVWEAVLTGDDEERLHLLAQAIPPLCRAFAPPGEVRASSQLEIVQHFLNRGIDAFVRESLSVTGLLPARRGQRKGVSLPEQWLQALSSEDATLTASPTALKSFAAAMHSWFDRLRPAELNAPFRTCFRLNPPHESTQSEGSGEHENNAENEDSAEDGENKVWQLSFHLQANDDRSLLVPAENIWQERSSTLTFLKRKFENPQERLLADLGKASRLFPALEESLTTARPSELKLSTAQAYAFLRESAPLLEQSGFGVLVPAWWQKPAARLGVKLKLKGNANANVSSGLMGLESVISYDWAVAIGDTTLTAREFEKLVRLKMPLVKVRGQWVELRPDEIEAAIAFFRKKRANGNISMSEALRLGLGQETSELGLPVIDVEGEGWVQDMLDRLSNPASLSLIETPLTFHGQLRPYQRKGVSWLAFLKQFGFGACLADDMGLGKTAEMIALLLHEREATLHAPALVICPMSIVGNWQRELQRFAPSLKVMVHHGHERLTGEAFLSEAKRHDVVITTYALALRDKEHLLPIEWEFVVVDEAQNIKNEAAKQTQAIKSLHAKYRIALTGTPVENRLSELWSIMEFLNPGYLGNGTAFRKQFALPIEKYRDAQKAEALKRLIQPFVLRRLKTDKAIIQDLPDKMEMKVFCNLTQEQATLYEATVQEMMERIEQADGMERRGLVLAALMRLKQICNHPAHFIGDGSRLPGRSGKLARLEEMLEEVLATGEKALIFTQFAEMGAMLRGYLQEAFGCEVLFLHGGVNKKMRDLMVQRFQEERRGPPIFILSLKAGGVGLNLTAANHVFHFDRWWNPAVENQATDRAFRIGQKNNVQVHKFVSVGTLEERIDQMIEQKKELAESIVGSGENWLTELSTAQLKELFALSREAVGE